MNALKALAATIREIFQFLGARQLWWLMPMVLVLLLFGGVIILGSATGVGPLIYTLF